MEVIRFPTAEHKYTPATDLDKPFEGPTVTYLFAEGAFKFCDSEGKTTKTIDLQEALQIAAILGKLLCNNAFVIESNLRYALKPTFKKQKEDGNRDYEAMRQAIEDFHRPFHGLKPKLGE